MSILSPWLHEHVLLRTDNTLGDFAVLVNRAHSRNILNVDAVLAGTDPASRVVYY